MLKLEEILCVKGLGKVFYNEKFGSTKFAVLFLEGTYTLAHMIGEFEYEFTKVGADLLDGFYTKD